MSMNTTSTIHFAVGQNMPGYSPDPDNVSHFDTFEAAKDSLLWDLKRDSDDSEDPDEADTLALTMEDVNLWSGPDTICVGAYAYWIMAVDCEDGCDEADESDY
jgi:hypothetical protein